MLVNSDDTKRPRETVAGTGNPPKWPEWGIYNYKAVVAYDGTNYKCVHMTALHADSYAYIHASHTYNVFQLCSHASHTWLQLPISDMARQASHVYNPSQAGCADNA